MNAKHIVVILYIIIETIPGEEDFILLLILAEIGMAMGHGSNSNSTYLLFSKDLQHSSSTLLIILKIFSAFSMGIGVYTSGSRMIKRVGMKFVTYTNTSAFAAQFSAMATTFISSVIGYPVSTSQTYFFSLLALRLCFNKTKIITMDSKFLHIMILLWIITPFVCLGVPIVLAGAFHLVQYLK